MTPAFVARLGPEHGAGPPVPLVVGLVVVNVLLVVVGLWQLTRERELARLREDFVAGVSHELRTPLAQIRMFSETLLLDRVRNPDEGRARSRSSGRNRGGLSQLVENVLHFHRHAARAAARRTHGHRPRAPSCARWSNRFKPLAASRRVQPRLTIPAREAIAMRADAGRPAAGAA